MMKCRQCESDVASTENFCPTCGKPALLENPELARHRRGILVGQVLILLLAVASGIGSLARLDLGTIDEQIAVLTVLKDNPKYDPGKIDGMIHELRESKVWFNYSTLALGSLGVLYAFLFVLSLFKPLPALVTAFVILFAATVGLLAVPPRIAPPASAVVPLVFAAGLLYGSRAARKRAIAIEESRAKTQPKPIVRTATRPPRPESPPSP